MLAKLLRMKQNNKEWISWHVIRDLLSVSLLVNVVPGKGVILVCEGTIATSQGWGTIRAGQNF